ncbi:Peroxisomal catalase [Vanrija pseudolonga]|uniref:Peroxisomal catalase n=1 Tax=Vanrija pseudolonga TaxID=143232 RepID=A0AAF0YG01_9TREE|nr:Peroxisomal catalase [Vanrija pseudolonga]
MAPNRTDRTYTLQEGCRYGSASTAQRFGDQRPIRGLMLLQDTQLIETLAHFNRERIPERTVHAGAVGAWGELEVTHDNSDLTSAAFLNGKGKTSKVLWRLSITGPRPGHYETTRDVRGWAMKIFTEEGNQDFVFNSIPTFFIRDPIKFPSMNRSHKVHPSKNAVDPNMFWDFHVNNQEGIHALMMLFSNRGIPANVRQLNGYSGHTYKLTRADSYVYVKIHFLTDLGAKGLRLTEAKRLGGERPSLHTVDMHEHIAQGKFPTWTMYAQVMTAEQAATYRWNIFDMTKVWPHKDFPLRPMARLTLNKNPENYFSDIEQAAFSPSTMVPGIAPSLDPMLQARMFAYPDAARYRVGVNYQQLPCNRPVSHVYAPYERDGAMRYMTNYGSDPSYVNSALVPVQFESEIGASGYSIGHDEVMVGRVAGYASEVTDDDFVQARAMWDVLGCHSGEQEDFVDNVVDSLLGVVASLQKGAIEMFARVDPALAKAIASALGYK